MRFAEVAHKIQDGDVLLYDGRLPHSFGIERHTRAPFSHAGVFEWQGEGEGRRLTVIEALESFDLRRPGCVQRTPFSTYLAAPHLGTPHWYALVDPRVDRVKLVEHARSKIGSRYASPLQLWWSFGTLPRLARCLLRGALANWGLSFRVDLNPDRYFCFKLVAESTFVAGFEPDPDDWKDPAETSGADIALWTCYRRQCALKL